MTTHNTDPGRALIRRTRFRTPFDLENVRRTNAAHGQVVGGADRSHAWQIPDAFHEFAAKSSDMVISVVPGSGQAGAQRQDWVGPESRFHSTQLPEAATEQTGARKENQRERHLQNHEDASEGCPAGAGRGTACRLPEC